MRPPPWTPPAVARAGIGPVVAAAALGLAVAVLAARAPVAGFALVGLVGLAIAVLTAPGTVLLALIAVLPWEDALAFPSATISVVKILGALLLVAYLIRAFARDEPLRLPGTLVALTVFAMAVAVSFAFSPDPGAGVEKVLRYALFAAFYFLVVQLAARRDLRRIVAVLVLSATTAAVYATTGFLSGTLSRAGGPLAEPNNFALLLASSLPLAGYLAVRDRRLRWLWVACALALAGGVLATLSRGGIVGLAVLPVWALATGRPRALGLAGGMALGIVVLAALAATLFPALIHERLTAKSHVAASNVASREAFWSGAVRMAADRPLTGVGPARFGEEAGRYRVHDPNRIRNPVVHNGYLEIAAEDGLPALAGFLAFLLGSLAYAARVGRADPRRVGADRRALAIAVEAALIAAMVMTVFESAQVLSPLWMLSALAAVLALGPRHEQPQSVPAGLA